MPSFDLVADISSDQPESIRPVIAHLFPSGVTESRDGFHIEATLSGESARELNRAVLSTLRREERRTRLRAAWTVDGITERFFDYVSKGTRPAR
jgi:hypothetical protein